MTDTWLLRETMKVGIDAFPIVSSPGGVANYVYSLLNTFNNLKSSGECIAYIPKGCSGRAKEKLKDPTGSIKWLEVDPYTFRWRGGLDGLDVFHGTNFKLQTRGSRGTVLTIHDLWLDRYPEFSRKLFGQRLSFYRTRKRAKEASKIIAVSSFTAAEIEQLYEVPSEKISVIHHGISSEFFPEIDEDKFSLMRVRMSFPNSPYILFVGGAGPRKNHHVLFQAFASNIFLMKNFVIIVVGNPIHKMGKVEASSEKFGISDKVFCVGMVALEELRLLYSHAALFVFPSKYEGFGFPILEAMACGVPVVTSNRSALPEIAGSAAALVNPDNSEELAHAMGQVLQDSALQASLRRKGLERIANFTWKKAATKTFELYQKLVNN